MKKILSLVALLLCLNAANAQYLTKQVTFDDYFMPDTNDYTIWFNGGMGYTYQMPVGPLGGYVIPPDSNFWGNGNPTFCYKYKALANDSAVASIDFLYDSTAVSATGFDRAVSLWFLPSADWNHYLYAAVTHNKKLEMSSYGWNNNSSVSLPLHHNHWYRLRLSATFISGFAGWMFTTYGIVYDLTGGTPVQIGVSSGGANDEVLPVDSNISVSFSGAKYGGGTKLDNFTYYGIPGNDSCDVHLPDTTTNAVSTPATAPLRYVLSGNLLSVQTDRIARVQLIDAAGRVRLTQPTTPPTTRLDLSALPAGLYMLNFGRRTARVVWTR